MDSESLIKTILFFKHQPMAEKKIIETSVTDWEEEIQIHQKFLI